MSDFLLDNFAARSMIKTLGLPVPLPARLRRADGPMEARPLQDAAIAVGRDPRGELGSTLASILVQAGAAPHITDPTLAEVFRGPGEAYGRPPQHLNLESVSEALKLRGLVFDGTGIRTTADLDAAYRFFHPLVRRVSSSGRIVVIGRTLSSEMTPEHAANQGALEGLLRSLAKEVGKRGSTAQLVRVEPGAEARLEGVLRFLLSTRSAFVSGQPLLVTNDVRAPQSVPFTRPLAGRIALVTGAARGIGAATAELLADEGAHVVCLDRPADDSAVSKVARSIGGSVLLADVSEQDAAAMIGQHLLDQHGGVDIVVHNAGITRDKTLGRMKPEQWSQTLGINLKAILDIQDVLLTRGVLRDEGRIVVLSSVSGIAGNVGQTNYAASKAGLVGYVRTASPQLAPRGITVNAIAPGLIETRMTAAMPLAVREAARRLSNLGQGGKPRDVGDAITFLSTPGAYGVTGQVLRVCGGALIGA